MDKRSDEELVGIVERFVLRARRVAAHSLAQDHVALDNLAAGAFVMTKKDGAISINRELPPEEPLESLAVRVRPMVLQQDPVFYGKALNALKSHLSRHDQDDAITWCAHLKKLWRSVDPATAPMSYSMNWSTMDATGKRVGDSQTITDAALALTWFYGDAIHAKHDQQELGAKFGIENRFAAAAVRVAQLTLVTIDTLDWVRYLATEGLVPVGPETLEAASVIATSAEYNDVTIK